MPGNTNHQTTLKGPLGPLGVLENEKERQVLFKAKPEIPLGQIPKQKREQIQNRKSERNTRAQEVKQVKEDTIAAKSEGEEEGLERAECLEEEPREERRKRKREIM